MKRRVMLVEDNPGDVALTRRAFRSYPVDFEVINNGESAVQRLLDPSKPRPELVLLDLNLPRVSGWEVLEALKRTEIVKRIPVIILTSSEADGDILRSYDLHANGYLHKPVTPDAFKALAEDFDKFWFGHIRMPPLENSQ
jgi:CheY-like chemotaxis protein